jgi:hypothetical protein
MSKSPKIGIDDFKQTLPLKLSRIIVGKNGVVEIKFTSKGYAGRWRDSTWYLIKVEVYIDPQNTASTFKLIQHPQSGILIQSTVGDFDSVITLEQILNQFHSINVYGYYAEWWGSYIVPAEPFLFYTSGSVPI